MEVADEESGGHYSLMRGKDDSVEASTEEKILDIDPVKVIQVWFLEFHPRPSEQPGGPALDRGHTHDENTVVFQDMPGPFKTPQRVGVET